jgi:hypothetical protein
MPLSLPTTTRTSSSRRVTSTAMSDDGYRAQLVNLADSHGGAYRDALAALYVVEREQLTPEEAAARVERDAVLLADMRHREQCRRLMVEIDQAGMLVAAVESTARAMRERRLVKLAEAAAFDDTLHARLVELAGERGGIYAEALKRVAPDPK